MDNSSFQNFCPPLIECRGLCKSYSGKPMALCNLDLDIYGGRTIGLLGPNGSGKTTFLKIAAGLLTPTSGSILIKGAQPGIESKAVVSYLPERSYLNGWMKVCDIINLFKDFYWDFNVDKAYSMLERLGISPKSKLKTMSKGTKEKIQLVLVMSREADIYLLDEPIGGVDPAARDYILETIISCRRPNSSLIISTHLISDVEGILDDALFLSYGNVVLAGEVEKLKQEHDGKTLDQIFREAFRC